MRDSDSNRAHGQHPVISILVRSAQLALPAFKFYILFMLIMHGLFACVEYAKNPDLCS